jgi:hypothetical protein
MKMTSIIINGPMLLKWNLTHEINAVTALKTPSSTYSPNLCSGNKITETKKTGKMKGSYVINDKREKCFTPWAIQNGDG